MLDTCNSHDSITSLYHSVNNVSQIYGKHVKYALENIARIILNIKGRNYVGVLHVSNVGGYYQPIYFPEAKLY